MRPSLSIAVIFTALVTTAGPCLAQDEPAPPEAVPMLGRAAPAPTSAPQSLADVARRTRLQQPADGEGIVISNANLHQLGDEGWLSVTGSATGPAVAAASSATSAETRAAWEQSYADQSAAVEALEDRLQRYNQAMTEIPDPYRQGRSPHSYAGGTQPQIGLERDQLEAQLELERAKLDRMRQQGRRLGVSPGWYDQQAGAGPSQSPSQ